MFILYYSSAQYIYFLTRNQVFEVSLVFVWTLSLGVSTMSVCMGIWAPVIRVPSPTHLASKEQFDRTVYGTVTPHIQLSSDGRIRPYDGREWSRDDSARHFRSFPLPEQDSPLIKASLRRHPHHQRLTDCPRPSANATSMRHLRKTTARTPFTMRRSLARPLTSLTSQA